MGNHRPGCLRKRGRLRPSPAFGQFVHDGIAHDLHAATRHGCLGSINSMSLRFSSADGKTRVEISVNVRWDGSGMKREDVQLASGTYAMRGYTVMQDEEWLTAKVTL